MAYTLIMTNLEKGGGEVSEGGGEGGIVPGSNGEIKWNRDGKAVK